MPTPSPQLHSLWAKTGDEPGQRHPLLWHLLDVAAMAEFLWSEYASQGFRTGFQHALRLDDQGQARAWFSWFAAMHDLGKATPYFQGQDAECASIAHAQGMGMAARKEHEVVGAAMITMALAEQGVDRASAMLWASAANISHGTVLGTGQIKGAVPDARMVPHPEYHPVVKEIVALLRQTLGATQDLPPVLGATVPLLAESAGIIKAADWLASSQQMFPYLDESMSAIDYLHRARRLASQNSWANRLVGWKTPTEALDFSEQFDIGSPRPVQSDAVALARDLPLPSLMVIEAPMGVGKTEAALAAAHEFARKGATGLFFALPTQATARAMHQRVTDWLARTGLASRGAILNSGDWSIKPPEPDPQEDFIHPDRDGQSTQARTEPSMWFRGPHRAMLSKVGAGTVDQVLLAAQPIRYGVARWAGLAGRVVIFDEVHAYDAFMNTLFERALQWLAQMGCPVIILSATLPSRTRQRMVDAYRSGLASKIISEPLTTAGYPCITTASTEGVQTRLPQAPSDHKVNVEHLPVGADDPASDIAAAVIKRAKGQAGVVGIICNTVDRAVHTAREIEAALPQARVIVLHSRFTARDRAGQTAKVLGAAGKEGLNHRADGLTIIVATQVIEQSIDIDLDWLVTEIAPVDLVLQRAGRLHRWDQTERPNWATQPVVTLIACPGEDGLPDLDTTSFIYNSHYPATMLSSWAALRGLDSLSLPSAISPLVERVYSEAEPDLPDRHLVLWRTLLKQDYETSAKGVGNGAALSLPEPWGTAIDIWPRLEGGKTAEEGGRYRSRDSEEDTELVALAYRREDGSLRPASSRESTPLDDLTAWRYSCVPVSGATLRAMSAREQPLAWSRGIMRNATLHVLNESSRPPVVYSAREGLERVMPDSW